MKLMLKTSLFLLLFLSFFSKDTLAATSFIKSPNNPLNFSNTISGWTETGQMGPSVIYDTGEFKHWYASYNGSFFKIGYATSNNGINWIPGGIVYEEANKSLANPDVLKDGNEYVMAYATSNQGISNFNIFFIKSLNGTNFDLNSKTPFSKSQGWESQDIIPGTIMKKGDTYYFFYMGRNNTGSNWKMGLATSPDLITWSKCNNNPLLENMGDVNIIEKEGIFYLFDHAAVSPHLISYRTSSDPISCNMSWTIGTTIINSGPESYDINHIISPSVLNRNGIAYLYYSGLGANGWKLNLATSQDFFPSPSPTPSPTLTPSPTPTPTPTPRPKTVVIPGFMSSWNEEAVVHNQQSTQPNWTMNPIDHEYDGIKATFNTLGFTENDDYFFFNYDWRKPVSAIADDLQAFMQAHSLDTTPVNLVGHSLGGVVARIYAQKHSPPNINKLITLGSPHQGVPHVYKALAAGEIETNNTALWLSEKVILQLMKGLNPLLSDKQVLTNHFPILKDLLPTYNYLKKANNQFVPQNTMSIKNTTTTNYGDITLIQPYTKAIYNNSFQSISGYNIQSQSPLDQFLGNYADGKPISNLMTSGDGLVTQAAAQIGTVNELLTPSGHGELAYSKKAIEKILQELDIPYTSNQITEGTPLFTFPSLLVILNSPVHLTATYNGQIFEEQDGLLYIPSATIGTVTLSAQGEAQGSYRIHIGRLINSHIHWDEIKGEITSQNPTSETDTYTISLSSQDAPVTQPKTVTSYLTDLEKLLKTISEIAILGPIEQAKTHITVIQKLPSLPAIKPVMDSHISQIHSNLVQALLQTKNNEAKLKNTLNLYHDMYSEYKKSQLLPSQAVLNTIVGNINALLASKADKLQKLKAKGQLTAHQQFIFDTALSYFTISTDQGIPYQSWIADIQLKSAQSLLQGL